MALEQRRSFHYQSVLRYGTLTYSGIFAEQVVYTSQVSIASIGFTLSRTPATCKQFSEKLLRNHEKPFLLLAKPALSLLHSAWEACNGHTVLVETNQSNCARCLQD